ncbi:TIGR03086 family metal-binding protein [Rhodococcus sp. NPDC058521]|uniref:TIGR03086 family metal-binding protein n=1 Tax=Rhodococcus sp. NPDC058521 TaxID=3346536 RepID=UPI003660BE43
MAFDWIELQRTAHHEFGARVDVVTDWSAPTPDTEWDVTDLIRHVVVEQQWIPSLLAGKSLKEAEAAVVPLHGDMREEWRRYSESASKAWAFADPKAPVHLSFGTVETEYYLRQQTADVTIHTWDLARASDTDEALDATLVEAVWADMNEQRDMLAQSGLFAPPVELPEDASLQEKLIALTGRDPRPPR